MNFTGCANCLLHGWKQVEDLSRLQRCTRCKLIQYCGRECQSEHWERVHKKQCRYFADPSKAQRWGHKEDDCVICLLAAQVGKSEICRATNLNYECILKDKFPRHMYHPHPFPVTGQPGQTYEKAIIVLWQLLKKLELTQPEVIRNCRGKLVNVFAELKTIRLHIWKMRKITRQSGWRLVDVRPSSLSDLLSTVRGKEGSDESVEDLFNIIRLVDDMLVDLYIFEILQVSQNPLADIPDDLYANMWQAIINSANYLAMANQLIEALTTQIVPYKDLVRIICGDSLEKWCHFCSMKTTITGIGGLNTKGSVVLFDCLFMKIYRCGNTNCRMEAESMMVDNGLLLFAVQTMMAQRKSTQCDFCLKLLPSQVGHRCSKCLTVMYCNTDCRDQDVEIHKEFCKEDVEERKKKFGSSGRRKEARGVLDQLENTLENLKKGTVVEEGILDAYEELSEAVSEFKIKCASKKTKK